MTTAKAEIENKYDVGDEVPLPALDDVAEVASVGPVVRHRLEATYFDTAELRLASHGVIARRRTGGDDAGWHLKVTQGDHRAEVQLPLGPAASDVPEELRSLVRGLVRDAPLGPIVVIRTDRRVSRLSDEAGRALADICDDRVEADVSALGPHPPSSLTWREWEAELVDGDPSLLETVADLLQDAGAVPAHTTSKLARALGDLLPEPGAPDAPPPRKKGPAADVVRARLSSQVERMNRLDPLVRCDATDAVHQMRVAMRRLRSALATYRPLLDRDVTEPLRDELKWLGQVLGAARDAEVMRARLTTSLDAEQPEVVRGPVLALVDRELGERYRLAHAESTQAMDSARYLAMLDRLDDLVADPPFTDPAASPTRSVLPGRVRHDWRRLKKRVKAVEEAEGEADRATRLHEVRKAAKRVRYAAEPLAGLYGKEAKRFIKAVKGIQSLLGEHQDSVVSRTHLTRLGDRAAAEGENAFTFGVLHAREQAAARAIEARFPSVWHDAADKRRRRWIS